MESGCDNIVTFPSQLTLKTTPTNSSLKLPSHVNHQDSDKSGTVCFCFEEHTAINTTASFGWPLTILLVEEVESGNRQSPS